MMSSPLWGAAMSRSDNRWVHSENYVARRRRAIPQRLYRGEEDAEENFERNLHLMRTPGRDRRPISRLLSGPGEGPFANLLPPHGVVQTFLVEKFGVTSRLHDPPPLEHVDAIRVHDCRE